VVQLLLTYGPFYKNVTTFGATYNKAMYKTSDAQDLKLKTGK